MLFFVQNNNLLGDPAFEELLEDLRQAGEAGNGRYVVFDLYPERKLIFAKWLVSYCFDPKMKFNEQ